MGDGEDVVPVVDDATVPHARKRPREESGTDIVSNRNRSEAEDKPSSSASVRRMLLETETNVGEEMEVPGRSATHSHPPTPQEWETQEEEKEVACSSRCANPLTILPGGVSPSTQTPPSPSSSLPSKTSPPPSSSTGKRCHSRREEEEEEDLSFAILGEHELNMLSHHKGIRSALRDSRLQSMIRSIDRSHCKLDALQLALKNDPCFKEFYDTTLSVITQAQMERASKPYFFSRA